MIESATVDFVYQPEQSQPPVAIITPAAFVALDRATQKRLYEDWRRQRISVLSYEFWMLTGVNPKSLQGD